jgi:sugar phosphate isomerase/epimerase
MKIACQEGMTPGKTLKEKFDNLEKWGFEGMEFGGRGLVGRVKEISRAAARSRVKPCTICAGYGGCLLDPDKALRAQAVADIKDLLAAGADLGVVGLILVPLFGPPRVPDLSPLADPYKLEAQLFRKVLDELAEHAIKVKCAILLEPLNRYEAHFLKRLDDAVPYARRFNSPYVRIMADFFHMNIEEADIAKSIAKAGKFVAHVHLADSNRVLPGLGHTDFVPGFAALKKARFRNYMALECGVPGDPMAALPKCAEFLREAIAKA